MNDLSNGANGINYGDIANDLLVQQFLDQYSLNKITIDHKVQEQELMRLKETLPTYADEIKETIAKNISRDVMKKIAFTKKHDKEADVHHFIGRVWVFTEDELGRIISKARSS